MIIHKTSDIARMLGVSNYTVVNWIKTGELTAYETLGGHYRVKRDDLMSFISTKNLPFVDELARKNDPANPVYRILIVDDDRNLIEIIKLTLKDLGVNTEIESALNGFDAAVKVLRFQPNLIILDAIMPGGDGDRVIKLVKNDESLKSIKILLFTAYPGDGRKFMKLGADSLMEKFSPGSDTSALRREVCRLLDIVRVKVLP